MTNQVFTKNSKTILSVDFDRRGTCPQFCDYCYVDNMERIYPAYLEKIQKNNSWSLENPTTFARKLDNEYVKARKSKAKSLQRLEKMPVRIYGSGDYIPEHYQFLSQVNFKFYVISKSLTLPEFDKELERLIRLPNCTNVILSFDNENIKNYEGVKHLKSKDCIRFAFTGDKTDWCVQTEYNNRSFNIFFNIGKKKVDVEYNKKVKEACPALAKRIPHDKACSVCNLCWRSSKTKGGKWNEIV